MYKRHRLSNVNLDNRTAVCSLCGIVAIKRNEKNEFRCTNSKTKKHVSDGAKRYEKGTSTIQKRYEMIRAIKDVPCADCGGSFPACCMDFDHRDRSKKVKAVSQMYCANIDKLMAEIEKCDIVCSNCHRIRESLRREMA